MKKYIVIDRIEGEVAYCETEEGAPFNIPLFMLPKDAKEQDWLTVKEGSCAINEELTKERRQSNLSLYKKLKEAPE